MEDKPCWGDQLALNLLNYRGSCWTVGFRSKRSPRGWSDIRGGGGGGGMLRLFWRHHSEIKQIRWCFFNSVSSSVLHCTIPTVSRCGTPIHCLWSPSGHYLPSSGDQQLVLPLWTTKGQNNVSAASTPKEQQASKSFCGRRTAVQTLQVVLANHVNNNMLNRDSVPVALVLG